MQISQRMPGDQVIGRGGDTRCKVMERREGAKDFFGDLIFMSLGLFLVNDYGKYLFW